MATVRQLIVNRLIPVYCSTCKGRNTWERQPERDIKTESGVMVEFAWQCRECGHKTLRPVETQSIDSK